MIDQYVNVNHYQFDALRKAAERMEFTGSKREVVGMLCVCCLDNGGAFDPLYAEGPHLLRGVRLVLIEGGYVPQHLT